MSESLWPPTPEPKTPTAEDYAANFRWAAAIFRSMAEDEYWENLTAKAGAYDRPPSERSLRDLCGRWISEAVVYWKSDHLKDLIRFHSAPTPAIPKGAMAVYARCPDNLFCDVSGVPTVRNRINHGLIAAVTSDGQIVQVPASTMGAKVGMFPHLKSLPPWERCARTCETLADMLGEQKTPSSGSTDASDMERALIAMGEDTSAKILVVAERTGLTADQKCRAIAALDERAYAWKSPKFAKMFKPRVSADAIRGTPWWKVDRKEWVKMNLHDHQQDDDDD